MFAYCTINVWPSIRIFVIVSCIRNPQQKLFPIKKKKGKRCFDTFPLKILLKIKSNGCNRNRFLLTTAFLNDESTN